MVEGDAPPPSARPPREGKRRGWSWRGLTRAVHRDAGHLAVGLTFVYALSGLAVNHIKEWEPSFVEYTRTHELGPLGPGTDEELAARVLAALGAKGPARDLYRQGPADLEIDLDRRTLHVDPATGHVRDEGQEGRFFFHLANWLHLNRGKKAWTYFADAYAAGLLLLAVTGVFINPGKKGLLGRGGVLLLVGAAIPIAYVGLSGGPAGDARARPTPPVSRPE